MMPYLKINASHKITLGFLNPQNFSIWQEMFLLKLTVLHFLVAFADWRPVHDGNNIITAVGDVHSMDMGYRLPIDINSHAFSKFTSVYFKVQFSLLSLS
jgi:hypothetical protein